MKIWVAVTDKDWFQYLSARQPDEVNFWQPSGSKEFRVLTTGEPFLFKLHSPDNFIVGGGFFVRYTRLPCSLAWEAFGDKNGVASLSQFIERIRKYRSKTSALRREPDPVIGCSILSEPTFFEKNNWIPVPSDWAPNIVQGKTYLTAEAIGHELWEQFRRRLQSLSVPGIQEDHPGYGSDRLVRGRLGQGAFRILVTDSYHRRCAITGERTLPVLEAAHIKPFSKQGPNSVRNGMLLRADLHKLFDLGFLTVTPTLDVVVSGKIKEEYENGREYYAYHGHTLVNTPDQQEDRPSREFLDWHNEQVFVE